jgi:DNA-binding response OmpR family regulator
MIHLLPTTTKQSAPLKIVLADVDASHHDAQRTPLALQGIELISALSGVECLHRLREHEADALVLDPDIPWGGGDGVLAVMRDHPQWAKTPVMVLTAARDFRLLNGIMRYAVQDFQRKPLAAEKFAARIRRLLNPSQRGDFLI